MTRICLVGDEDATLPADLLTYATVRDALSPYEVAEPYANALAVETVSLGAAVSLLNDLDWYLRRHVGEALVLEPSVSGTEWLTRALATAIRNDRIDPDATGEFLKVFGVIEHDSGADGPSRDHADDATNEGGDADPAPSGGAPRLVEPMFVRRVDEAVPDYDLREVDDVLVVRVTADEFGT